MMRVLLLAALLVQGCAHASACRVGWYNSYPGSCYHIEFGDKKIQSDAASSCAALDASSKLAFFESQEEMDAVWQLIREIHPNQLYFWIDAQYCPSDHKYHSQDCKGSVIPCMLWAPNEPNGFENESAAILAAGTLNDVTPLELRDSICEMPDPNFEPVASDCMNSTDLGKGYIGIRNVTTSCLDCQDWDSQTPHSHNNNNICNFPETQLKDAANFCRNPDDTAGGPWCYTTDPNTRWESCDIPLCA